LKNIAGADLIRFITGVSAQQYGYDEDNSTYLLNNHSQTELNVFISVILLLSIMLPFAPLYDLIFASPAKTHDLLIRVE
jgi:hypothetical protein